MSEINQENTQNLIFIIVTFFVMIFMLSYTIKDFLESKKENKGEKNA